MTDTVLLLARHGATQANLCRPYTLQGLRPDSELVDIGVQQSRATGEAVRAFPIVEVYCSPLKRARHTARIISEMLGVPLVIEDGLVEVDLGLWAGLSWEEISRRWPKEHQAFHEEPEQHGYLGGENLRQVLDRTLPVIEGIAARHQGETVLVVSHGVVNRVLAAHWLGIPLRYARRLPSDNGGFNVVEFAGGVFRVRTLNQSAHLAGAAAHLLAGAAGDKQVSGRYSGRGEDIALEKPMPATEPQRTPEDLARLGAEAFDRHVRPTLQPEDDGKFVAIDVVTGDHEIDEDDSAAVMRLRARRPAADIWLARVGHPTAYKLRRDP